MVVLPEREKLCDRLGVKESGAAAVAGGAEGDARREAWRRLDAEPE